MLRTLASRPGAWRAAIAGLIVAGAAVIALRDHAGGPAHPNDTATLATPRAPTPERQHHRAGEMNAATQVSAPASTRGAAPGKGKLADGDDVGVVPAGDAGGGRVAHATDRAGQRTASVHLGEVLPAMIERPGWHGDSAETGVRHIGPPLNIEALAGRTITHPGQQPVNLGAPLEFDADGLPASDFPPSPPSDIGALLEVVPARGVVPRPDARRPGD